MKSKKRGMNFPNPFIFVCFSIFSNFFYQDSLLQKVSGFENIILDFALSIVLVFFMFWQGKWYFDSDHPQLAERKNRVFHITCCNISFWINWVTEEIIGSQSWLWYEVNNFILFSDLIYNNGENFCSLSDGDALNLVWSWR